MASGSLQSRLMLNCKLSGRTKFGSALTVGIVKAQCSRKSAPYGGSGKREAISTGDETMKIGRDIGAERQCPCPLWGLQVIASAITCGG